MTVEENLQSIAEITINNASARNEKVNSLISKFELDPVRDIEAKLLSGGKEKISIAITLITDPKFFLMSPSQHLML